MVGTNDIIWGGAAILGSYLVITHWQEINDWITQNVGGGVAAAAPAPAPPASTDTSTPDASKPTLTSRFSTLKPRLANINPATAFKQDPKCVPSITNSCGVLALPGYYRNYSIPVMGPQWKLTQPAGSGPAQLDDPYLSYHSEVFKKQSYHTVIDPHSGAKITTIDPFFPAGFYNSQANYRSSLKDPAVRGGS